MCRLLQFPNVQALLTLNQDSSIVMDCFNMNISLSHLHWSIGCQTYFIFYSSVFQFVSGCCFTFMLDESTRQNFNTALSCNVTAFKWIVIQLCDKQYVFRFPPRHGWRVDYVKGPSQFWMTSHATWLRF